MANPIRGQIICDIRGPAPGQPAPQHLQPALLRRRLSAPAAPPGRREDGAGRSGEGHGPCQQLHALRRRALRQPLQQLPGNKHQVKGKIKMEYSITCSLNNFLLYFIEVGI